MIEATNQNAINKSIDEAHYYNVFVWNHKNLEEKHKKNMGFVRFCSRYFYLVPNFRSFCLRKVLPWSRVDCVLGCHRRGTTPFFTDERGFSGGHPKR